MWTLILIAAVFLIAFGAASGQSLAQVFGRQMDAQPQQQPTGNWSAQIVAMANAIAIAEGSNPTYDNPGDLKPPGWQGPTFGAGIAWFGPQGDGSDGWQRLYYQLQLIVNGQSAVYSLPGDTIQSMAVKWTGNDHAAEWAQTVAQQLGVPVTTQLSQVLS